MILVLIAYGLKAPARKFQIWHYVSGLAAWLLMFVTVGIAFWALGRRTEELGEFPVLAITLQPHFIVAILLLVAMTFQSGIGIAMWTNKRLIPYWRLIHWRISQVTLVLLLLLGLMGIPLAYGLLAGRLIAQVILLSVAIVFILGVSAWVLALEQRSLRASEIRRVPILKDLFNPAKPGPDAIVFTARFQPDDKDVPVYKGQTLLEASLVAGIPHTHVCGGNARCSTCRIVVLTGVENLSPRNDRELVLADRLNFGTRIRLACQTEISGDVSVRRLVQDETDISLTSQLDPTSESLIVGREFDAAILFADIKRFSGFAASQLPYDVIHALNRYFTFNNALIASHGGVVNNYMGDGFLALFRETPDMDASSRAYKAGLNMFGSLGDLRNYFLYNYGSELDIRVGLHYGRVIAGQMGGFTFAQQSVIGEAVNFTNSLLEANKDAGTRFLISDEIYKQIGNEINLGRIYHFTPKGRTERVNAYEVILQDEPQQSEAE